MEKEENKKETTKPCPLCETMLPYDRWLEVIGVYEEQQKHRKELESELNKAKKQELKLREEYKKFRQKEKEMRAQYSLRQSKLNQQYKTRIEKLQEKFNKEKERVLSRAKKEGIKIGSEKEKERIEKLKQKFQREQDKLERQKQRELKQIYRKGIGTGVEKQKTRMEKVNQMAEKHRKERDKAMERVKQLEEMLKKGTTPQIEGFNFEQDLTKQLKQKFPEDAIEPTGHKGDIIHTVQAENKKAGKIIYECKKTKEFDNKFIEQVRRDKTRVIADYGVIVTWATKENKQNFWLEEDIIIVHPYGVLDIATFLRETLIQMYALKLSKAEFEAKGKAILELMQSEEFRVRILSSIAKSREAYEVLKKEITTHFNAWNKRARIYESIHRNTSIIQNTVQYVLLHGKIPENLPRTKELPPLQTLQIPQKNEPNKKNGQNEMKNQ